MDVATPVVSEVAPDSPAARAGLLVGDVIELIEGVAPLDVIEYQQLVDRADPALVVRREGAPLARRIVVAKPAGEPLGIRVDSAVFDRIRTCDNHCEFCFIYQLPKGLRRSLYLKDDDYRLSFLYGNFTTLTRFTELDAERVIEERLSPLYVSIHATDPSLRAAMLRNPRGATSLRWLDVLLEAGIEVHGQVVVCPGVNDGEHLARTLGDTLDRFAALSSVGVVPLGTSDHSNEPTMRPHTADEAGRVLDLVERFGDLSLAALGERRIYASDEFYLVAGRAMPTAEYYEGFGQLENGIGMAAALEAEFSGTDVHEADLGGGGFFHSVDGAPPWGYRATRADLDRPGTAAPVILTGEYGAQVLTDLLDRHSAPPIEVLGVENTFFGGNTAVAGLLCGADLSAAMMARGAARYVLPDVCLSEGRFLDGTTPAELPFSVEVVETSGVALRALVDQEVARTRAAM
jgi:putative radical SAM enzyme (TIGR03279 family)